MKMSHTFSARILLIVCCLTALPSLYANENEAWQGVHEAPTSRLKTVKKKWTVIVYIAGDNDLYSFAWKNINQMMSVGSNDLINILVQLDAPGRNNKTQRFFIERGRARLTNQGDASYQKLDSGAAETLIDCCRWAINGYPAEHYGLVLWNHGIGILDTPLARVVNPSSYFVFNPHNQLLEIDRNKALMYRLLEPDTSRWICYSETYGSFLSNDKLERALSTISSDLLGGNKLDLVSCDACLMSMMEMASYWQQYANIMVASQEVELGMGLPYHLFLAALAQQPLTPTQFAAAIVTSYRDFYKNITGDYTMAATDLSQIAALEQNITAVSNLLLQCLNIQDGSSVKNVIKMSRSRWMCTTFAEPSYVDLHHLYKNLLRHSDYFKFTDPVRGANILLTLKQQLTAGAQLIENCVIYNTCGRNLPQARGLSIYFPEDRIDATYRTTRFVQRTQWLTLLSTLLAA